MATNISVYDLQNFPSAVKTVTVDLKKVTPVGAYGDDKWVLNATTGATASGSVTIQGSFVDHMKVGWCKSSGVVSEPFTIDATHNSMKVAIDEAIASAATIVLSISDTPVAGDSVAADIESKLNALTVDDGDKEGNLSYLNAKCYYENGRFVILSGGLSDTYTGTGRSSVSVTVGASNDVASTLGFDINFDSVTLAGQTRAVTYVTSLVSSSTTVPLSSVSNFAEGDCVGFKTAAGNTYYRYVDSVSDPNIVVNTAISLASGSVAQLLKTADPDGTPASYYTRIDDLMRHSIDLLVRQINFA